MKLNVKTNIKILVKQFRKISFFYGDLSSLDNLANLLGHRALVNPFKCSIGQNSSIIISSEHFFRNCECFRSRTKEKLE